MITILLNMYINRLYIVFILFFSCASTNLQKKEYYSHTIINSSLRFILINNINSDTVDLFIDKNIITITPNHLTIKKIYNCFEKDDYKGYLYLGGKHLFIYGNLESSLAKQLMKRNSYLKKDLLYSNCDDDLIPTTDYESMIFELDTLSNKLIQLNNLVIPSSRPTE